MRYARLDTCPTTDLEYCFVNVSHESALWLAEGESIGARYPADPHSVRIPLAEDFPGVRLPDLLGNSSFLLILSLAARQAFAAAGLDLGVCEVCPFTLVNHKGRIHSTDYAFVNPLGGQDIAHPASSFKRYESDDEIYDIDRWVLDARKLADKPDLLRAQEVMTQYFVSERLMAVVGERGLTNFAFETVEQRDGAS